MNLEDDGAGDQQDGHGPLGAAATERWLEVLRLAANVHGVKASEIDAGWRMICEHLGGLLRSRGGFTLLYIKTDRGVFQGWQPVRALEYGEGAEIRREINRKWAADPVCLADPYASAIFDTAGVIRAMRTTDLAPTAEQRAASASYRLIQECGLIDRMIVACVVSSDVEVHFGFDRARGQAAFSPEDRRTALAAAEMLTRPCRWLALGYGYYPRQAPLSDRERDVLSELLAGASEKEVAYKFEMTTGSVHQVVVRLYRKLGVRSRPELMALWLGDTGPEALRGE